MSAATAAQMLGYEKGILAVGVIIAMLLLMNLSILVGQSDQLVDKIFGKRPTKIERADQIFSNAHQAMEEVAHSRHRSGR